MNLPEGYIAGSDSMYLHIFAPSLQAATAGMKSAMMQMEWAKAYVEYVVGEKTEQPVNSHSVRHCIVPVQTELTGWILEIPKSIALHICSHMQQWLNENPAQLQNVDLLTKEQAQNIDNPNAPPVLRGTI
jgi:hypothetical protein